MAVMLAPTDDLAARISSYDEGTAFTLRAGIYRGATITPKDHMMFQGELGAVLDGEGVTPCAFETFSTSPAHVTLRNLCIRGYSPPLNLGAIQADNGTDWTIENCEIVGNANAGLKLGPRMVVRDCIIHQNGVAGILSHHADDVLIEDNRIFDNNPTATYGQPGLLGTAGVKCFGGRNLILRGNYVHHNNGFGLWCDTVLTGTQYERNWVTRNAVGGLFHEGSGSARMRLNTVLENGLSPSWGWLGHAGICVVNSEDVEIDRNNVAGNTNGITAMMVRSDAYGTHEVRNLWVHDNTIVNGPWGRTGLAQNIGDLSYFTSRGNRFTGNTYFGDGPEAFAWMDRYGSWVQWQAFGQDLEGSMV